jgi:pyrimidine-specific ribonucleoside hydrolase
MRSRRRPTTVLGAIFAFAVLPAIPALFCSHVLKAQAPPRRALGPRTVIIDTDAGGDDLMAIAFLLSRPDIRVEAITVVNGMAHVPAGARNILRLLELAGRRNVPVFLGEETPSSGDAEFPAAWRQSSDELPGVTLPDVQRAVESLPADEYLSKRLADAEHPVQVLALGPLTNLAAAFARAPRAARILRQLVIMGGAIGVSGNLGDGGAFKTVNTSSEWNLYIDPAAAKTVFTSGALIRLVPLDATQRVRIDMALLEQFQARAATPLARVVAQVLATSRESIRQGFYFAWDPLAAVALANPSVATFRLMAIEISERPGERGRTIEIKNRRPNMQVATDADSLRFREVFTTALGVR